jgi:enterochelin esterase-like enzyme
MRTRMYHLLAASAALLLTMQLPAAEAPAAAAAPPVFKSPEVLPDRRVTFRLYAPKATEVKLSADFLDNNRSGASRPMQKDAAGVWSITQGPLPADFYMYSFNVDGVATLDPRSQAIKEGVASRSNLFEVPGPATAFEDARRVPHGAVSLVWYHSEVAGRTRRMHVYTPPGYEAGNAKYPVLYLVHGGGDIDTGWIEGGRANFILDNLIADGKARPMIIVMPDFNMQMPLQAAAGAPAPTRMQTLAWEQDLFVKELTGSIIPHIEKTYRVRADRDNRALAGLSMGGARVLRTGPSHLNLFSYLGVFSMGLQKGPTQGVPDDFEERNAQFLKNAQESNRQLKLFWIGVGNDDDRIFDGGKLLSETLNRHGIRNEFHESGGGHSWPNWRRYLNEFAPRLFAGT